MSRQKEAFHADEAVGAMTKPSVQKEWKDSVVDFREEKQLSPTSNPMATLLVRLGSRCCALPLEYVVETMRPLPTEPMHNAPEFIRGLATIRGLLVPVVNLANLFVNEEESSVSRFVLLRLGERRAAIAVEEVIGVRSLESSALQTFPPLLQDAHADLVHAIEVRDHQFSLLLRVAQIVPEQIWQRLKASEVDS